MAAARALLTVTTAIAGLVVPRTAVTVPAPRQPATAAAVVGDLRVHAFTSRVFGNTRSVRVLVPAGYDAPAQRTRRYPALYLNDGQHLFDPATSIYTGQEWRVDETVAALVAAGRIPPLIVVGIDHAGRNQRFHEYFPYRDAFLQPPDPDPQGRRYPDFLVDEVLPFVEARYRVEAGPGRRGLGGSSAGGLAALYAVIARPGVFGRLLVESPSIYVDDARILKEAAAVRAWPARVYIGAGTAEGPPNQPCPAAGTPDDELVADVKRLVAMLHRSGVDAARVRLTVAPCGRHTEAAWGSRLPDALAFLYGDSPR